MIIRMMEDCQNLSSKVWIEYAMRRDVLYNKTSFDQRQELGAKAEECGAEEARKLKDKIMIMGEDLADPYNAAKTLGLEIFEADPFAMPGYYLFAEFEEPNKVYIHKETIRPAAEQIEGEEALEFLHIPLEHHLIYHEIFHFIESRQPNMYTRTQEIDISRFGIFKGKSTLLSLGEIAGMKFVAEMLDIEYSPFILDMFFLYPRDPEAAQLIYKEIMEIKEDMNRV